MTWVLIVVLLGVIGTMIWWFGARGEVKAAQAGGASFGPWPGGAAPGGPAPGWCTDPGGRGQRYWDGRVWTDHYS